MLRHLHWRWIIENSDNILSLFTIYIIYKSRWTHWCIVTGRRGNIGNLKRTRSGRQIFVMAQLGGDGGVRRSRRWMRRCEIGEIKSQQWQSLDDHHSSPFRPELCSPATLAHSSAWTGENNQKLFFEQSISREHHLVSNSTSCRRNPSFGRTSRCFRTWRHKKGQLLHYWVEETQRHETCTLQQDSVTGAQ